MNSERTPSRLPSYKDNDPKGWCGDITRGAALGRSSIIDEDCEYEGVIHLRRVYLNNGGYDSNGTYFGGGAGTLPLYWYANKEGTIDCMTRARNREHARQIVLKAYPKAKVRR